VVSFGSIPKAIRKDLHYVPCNTGFLLANPSAFQVLHQMRLSSKLTQVLVGMRTQVWLGLAIIAGAPALLAISYALGVIANLTSAVETVIITTVGVMFVSGFSLLWNARKPEEQGNQRKNDIWEAIAEWIEPPPNPFQIRGAEESLFLGEKVPRLVKEIDDCLSKHYPTIWADMQEFRRKYGQLMDMKAGKIPDEFWENIDGRMTLHYNLFLAREDSMHRQLVQIQKELTQQLKSKILEKHYTRLKC
jgi:hypothetical protein